MKKMSIALVAAGGTALALLAGTAHADARVHLHIGVPVYTQPSYVYTQPGYVYAQPGYVYSQPGYGYYHRPHHRGRGYDRDRDGVPNRYDRDRDGDGVPNRWDHRPNNPRRY